MQINIMIKFDAEDKRIIKESLAPMRLVDSAEFRLKAGLASSHINSNNNVEVSWATDLLEVLFTLKTHIQKETNCKADPEWIKRTEHNIANGEVPLVQHPKQSVALLCDIRKSQLKTVDAAIAVTQKAIDMCNDFRQSKH